jgi:hypothetical protein
MCFVAHSIVVPVPCQHVYACVCGTEQFSKLLSLLASHSIQSHKLAVSAAITCNGKGQVNCQADEREEAL